MGIAAVVAIAGLWLSRSEAIEPQPVDSLVAEARTAAAMRPRVALDLLRRALALDSLDYEANWRTAVARVDLVQLGDSVPVERRDSLYREAERVARRAVPVDSTKADGYFALGMVLGRVALTKGKRDRIRFAKEIYDVSTRALRLDPRHDGVHHILALWHAEAMRTSGFNRFLARNLLGGKVLGEASWAKAIEHLETAVEIDPDRIFHRLDLARIYVDRKDFGAARVHLVLIERLPDRVARDPAYREEAAALLARIGRTDPPS
jgi:tetratricopeptide (TPR) repeat protein